MLTLPCYARRRGLGLRVFMTDVSLLINGLFKVATKHTSGWIEAPGFYQDLPIFLWTATQAQRDHEIIQTRNLRVQPQAIMGSGIVD